MNGTFRTSTHCDPLVRRFLRGAIGVVLIVPMALMAVPGRCPAESVPRDQTRLASLLDAFGEVAAARSSWDTQLLKDAADGHWDQFTLWEAALIADGLHDDGTLARCSLELDQLRNELSVLPLGDEPGRVVFEFMQQRVLKGVYRARCSLARSLDQGDFNCLTATILFQCLCESRGIKCHAVSATAHVYCRMSDSERDVETTARTWVWAVQPLEGDRGGAEVRVITPVELVGKIYYNRGSGLLEQGRFAEAIETLRIALHLDPQHRAAHTNFLAAVNNWALAECDAGAYPKAARLVTQGLQLAPDYEPLQTNDLYVHHRWSLDLCRTRRFEEALRILQQAQKRRPDATLFQAGQLTVYRAWAMSLLESDRWLEARTLFHEAQRHYADRDGLQACAHQAIRDFASQVEARGDHLRAQAALELLKTLPDEAG